MLRGPKIEASADRARRLVVPPGQRPWPASRRGLDHQIGGHPGQQIRYVVRASRVTGDRLDEDVMRARDHGRGRSGPADQDQPAHRPGRRQPGREPPPRSPAPMISTVLTRGS